MDQVVVGFDGSKPSMGAMRWAAEEASIRGAVPMMLFTTEVRDHYVIIHLHGELKGAGAADRLAEHIAGLATRDLVLIDLSDVKPIDLTIGDLLSQIEHSLHGRDLVVVHHSLQARRRLRSMGHILPVVPDIGCALRGSRSAIDRARAEAR